MRTEVEASSLEPQFVGIGGWLMLPAIGLVVGMIKSIVSMIASLALFSYVEDAGYGGLYAFELLVEMGLLFFLIYAATCFFGKRRNAPSMMIGLMTANIIAIGVLLMIELGVGAETFVAESTMQLVRGVIGAAIWIPYFNIRPSKLASGHCPLFGPPHWSRKSSHPKHLEAIWPGPKTGQRMWPKNGVFGQPTSICPSG